MSIEPENGFLSSWEGPKRARERHLSATARQKYAVEADFPDFAGSVSGANGGYFG